jgi:hypothetical protein
LEKGIDQCGNDPAFAHLRGQLNWDKSERADSIDERADLRRAAVGRWEEGVAAFPENKFFYGSLGMASERMFRETADRCHAITALEWFGLGLERTADPQFRYDVERLQSILK